MTGPVCPSGKVRHPDRQEARRALSQARAKRDGGPVESRVYRCPDCSGWHLTHKKRKRWT